MLILAITCTITTIFAIINVIPNLKGLSIAINAAKIVLYVILCVGVWNIFINGRRPDNRSVTGFNFVRGYITTIYTVIMIIACLFMVLVFVAFGMISEFVGDIPLSDNLDVNGVLIIIIIALVAVITVMSLFFKSLTSTLKTASGIMVNRPATKTSFYLAAVILILIGIVKFVMIFVTSIVYDILGAILEQMSFLSSIMGGMSIEYAWSEILVDVAGMINYLLGGVLIIIFSVKMKKVESSNMMI